MLKPSLPRLFLTAGSIVVIAVVATVAVLGGGGLRRPRGSAATRVATAPVQSAEQHGLVRASLGALPLAFEANQGQTDPRVKYMARGNGYTVFLTAKDAVFTLRSASAARPAGKQGLSGAPRTTPQTLEKDEMVAISMRLVGGNSQAQIAPSSRLPGRTNYFIGHDPSQWHTDVAQYARISYRQVYPGVNLAFYGVQRQLEFDFIVAPGASPAPIRFGVSGARRITTDHSGDLVLSSSAGDVLLHKPAAYQDKNGARQPVDARFILEANNQVSFELGPYDHGHELVIDPSVSYATYLGGTAEDDGEAIAIDSSGNAYVTGQTMSTNFPIVGGVGANTPMGGFDVFITKISPDGSTLSYSTYIGGSLDDSGNAIAVDASGDAFVAGGTASTNFPITAGAFQTALGAGAALNAFILKLNPAGNSLLYSTYLGGGGSDVAVGIALALDSSGDAYVVGSTSSTNFPIQSPFQSTLIGASNAFVTKLNSSGSAPLMYSTYLGAGTGDFASAVAVDSSGNAYVTGGTPTPTFPTTSNAFQKTCGTDGTCNGGLPDAFVTVFNPAGSGLVYSTFLGGEGIDDGLGIAVDAAGDAYVTGLTQSKLHFPLKSPLQLTFGAGGIQNAFVAELNPSGSALVYSTFLGGNGSDAGTSIALDANKNAYVTGETSSSTFPTANPTQGTLGGMNDAFVSEINASGSPLLFSTYLGGTLNENTNASGGNLAAIGSIAVASTGANIYVTGNTASTNFPTKAPKQSSNAGGTDAFVAKYAQPPTGKDFIIAGTALAAVSQGGSTTSTITITSVDGYTGTVNFTCSVASVSGGTPLPTCSIPNAVTGGAGTSKLTLSTTGATMAGSRGANRIFYAMWLPIVGLSLAGMRWSTANSRKRKFLGFQLLGLIMATLFFLPACSSSNSGGGGGCPGCTPKGNYSVSVTGTDSANANLKHSVSPALTLTVN